jgi:two-component system chemotaxis response regulator CheY
MNQRPRVCLIEDNGLVRESLAFSLRDHGYEVMASADGREGLALVLRERFDAVITDLDLPGLHGLSLIREFCSACPDVPVLAITGGTFQGGQDVTETAREAGAVACLLKPFKPGDLMRALAAALASKAGPEA